MTAVADATPDVIAHDLIDVIKEAITNHPRSLQKTIGPSEIGIPCTIRLIHKLAGHDEPDRGPAWKPTVGTAVHAWLEGVFSAANADTPVSPRYALEQRVTVGDINGRPVSGSCDMLDRLRDTVVDWKCVGPSRLKHYRASGPGQQYRTQAHLYGRGWLLAGQDVATVMIVFIPRDGELHQTYAWHEPFDESVATTALARATGLAQLIQAVGVDTVLAMYPACKDEWCPWCATRPPYGTERQQVAVNTAALFNINR